MTPKRLFPVVLVVFSVTATAHAGAVEQAGRIMGQVAGRDMSATSAETLEAVVRTSPDDVNGRVALIAYYHAHQSDSLEARLRHRDHVLWMIRHHPEMPESCDSNAQFMTFYEGTEAIAAAKTEWVHQIQDHPGSTVLLDHAAEFHWLSDRPQTEQWLAAAEKLESRNPHWAERTGYYALMDAKNAADAGEQYAKASRALAAYERAMKLTPTREGRLGFLDDAAWAAWFVKRDDKAEQYAKEFLKETPVSAWNFSDAVNQGYTILGLVALRRNDLKAAAACLAQSGDVKGSPVLNSFGPEFRLATALVGKGQRQAVLDYLEAVGAFWAMGKPRLDRWTKALNEGATPDFNQYK
jgi:hypothetical protein